MRTISNSGMVERTERLDSARGQPYRSTVVELSARSFERYVLDKVHAQGISNDYLVNIRKADEHAAPQSYAYPTNAELDGGIREAFDKLFRTIKTRETDKGTAFYSRQTPPNLGAFLFLVLILVAATSFTMAALAVMVVSLILVCCATAYSLLRTALSLT
ncbi:hypothetical protein QWJ20_10690 [Pectobacterium sp. S5]|uniref:LPD1 domain-containing protein n=1 Tax=Pectobacterium TaxID=122277 RepID=UPI003D9B972C